METQKKTLGKLKLNKLSENELNKRSMKVLKGGCGCEDGCKPTTSVNSSNVTGY